MSSSSYEEESEFLSRALERVREDVEGRLEDETSYLQEQIEETLEKMDRIEDDLEYLGDHKAEAEVLEEAQEKVDERLEEVTVAIEGKADSDSVKDLQRRLESLKEEVREVTEVETGELESRIEMLDERLEETSERVEEMEPFVEGFREELEEIEEAVDGFEERLSGKADSEVVDDIDEKLERISEDELEVIDELVERMERVEERVGNSEGSQEESEVGGSELEEFRSEIEDVKRRMNDLMEYVDEMTVTRSDVRRIVEVEMQTSSESAKVPELSPEQVNRHLVGSSIKVSGNLELQKETEDGFLYTLNGDDGWVIVRSDEPIGEGSRTLDADVESLDGSVYLEA